MAIEINTVLDLSDGQDKTLDSSFRFLLQDPYIESCLLKDFCKEVQNMSIEEIEVLLRKDNNGRLCSRIELLHGASKIQGLINRDADFVYKIDNGDVHLLIDIEAQRNHLNVTNMHYRGQDYCKRINIAEQIKSDKLPLCELSKAYCFFLCFFSSSNKEEVIYFKNCRSDKENGPYIPALSSMSEVIIINLGLPFEKLKYRSSKLLWILFKYPMSFDDKMKMLKDELDIELEKESIKEMRKMCDYLREMVEQGIEQGMEQGFEKGVFESTIIFIKKLMENNQTFDEACSFIGIDKLTKEKLINTGLFY